MFRQFFCICVVLKKVDSFLVDNPDTSLQFNISPKIGLHMLRRGFARRPGEGVRQYLVSDFIDYLLF